MIITLMIGLLYNEAQQDAKVAQTTLTCILTVHKNEKKNTSTRCVWIQITNSRKLMI